MLAISTLTELFSMLTGLFMMVRNNKRQTRRKAIQQDVFDQAKVDLQQGDRIRSVAVKYGMDESTLRKRLKMVILLFVLGLQSDHGVIASVMLFLFFL